MPNYQFISRPANYLLYNPIEKMAVIIYYSLLITHYSLLNNPYKYDNCFTGHDITQLLH